MRILIGDGSDGEVLVRRPKEKRNLTLQAVARGPRGMEPKVVYSREETVIEIEPLLEGGT